MTVLQNQQTYCVKLFYIYTKILTAFKKESHKDLKKHEAKCLNKIFLITNTFFFCYLLLEKNNLVALNIYMHTVFWSFSQVGTTLRLSTLPFFTLAASGLV